MKMQIKDEIRTTIADISSDINHVKTRQLSDTEIELVSGARPPIGTYDFIEGVCKSD